MIHDDLYEMAYRNSTNLSIREPFRGALGGFCKAGRPTGFYFDETIKDSAALQETALDFAIHGLLKLPFDSCFFFCREYYQNEDDMALWITAGNTATEIFLWPVIIPKGTRKAAFLPLSVGLDMSDPEKVTIGVLDDKEITDDMKRNASGALSVALVGMMMINHSAQFNSAVIFCHNDQLTALIPHLATEFDKYCVCFWHKENPMPVANRHYQPECEIYIHAWKKDSHPVGTLSELKRVFFGPLGKSEYDHPTVKPLALMRKIVRNMNAETICDPYMGTASTGVACVGLQKKFIGIEKEPRFFDIACRRIEEAYRQPDFFVPPPAKVKQDSFI